MEAVDYSNRRGALVPILPKIHALLVENAEKDTLAAYEKPENIIFWKQKMGKELLDINRRFVIAAESGAVAGLMFYYFNNKAAYIYQLQTAWLYRNNPRVMEALLDKFAGNKEVKECGGVYAGENIKAPRDKELLAAAGFKETFPGGWEPLGAVADAVNLLKLRY